MKRINKPWAVAAVFAALLFISMIYTAKYANLVDKQRAKIAHLQASSYKLDEYKEALKLSDIIMDNNDLWDRDGSDVMSDYLNMRANMDTTFYHGFHRNALLDSIALNYDEQLNFADMRPILLLDRTNHVIREFDTYRQANQFRMMNNRPDWTISSRNYSHSAQVMVTLNMVNQYALDNSLGDDSDIFSILSQMQLGYREDGLRAASTSLPSPPAPGTDFDALVEYSTQDLLNLLSTQTMVLTKEKAALLLEKLWYFCQYKGIGLPKDASLRDIELARMVLRRYGSVVLMDDDGSKFLCNNPKYLKRWIYRQSATKAGSSLRMANCGKYAKYRIL